MILDGHFHPADLNVNDSLFCTDNLYIRGVGASSDPEQWDAVIDWGRSSKNPFALGIHPWSVPESSEEADRLLDRLKGLIKEFSPCAAGEIGLDYSKCSCRQRQAEIFRKQVELSCRYDLPCVVHCVKAFAPAYAVFKEFESCLNSRRGLIHGFWGSAETCACWVKMGFSVSLNPKMILKASEPSDENTNPWAEKLKKILSVLPAERLILESDAPWGLKSSADILLLAEILEDFMNMPKDDIISRCGDNLRSLFLC